MSTGAINVCVPILISVLVLLGSSAVSSTSLAEECGEAIQTVTSCMTYATGKALEPTKPCCDAVSGIKEKEPVCLCFFIGQVHNGSTEIKSLGLQESKLLQLPSACHLTNASTSNCPKLLGISPTSGAAAIFMDKNATTTTTTTPGTQGGQGQADINISTTFKQQNCAHLIALILLCIII